MSLSRNDDELAEENKNLRSEVERLKNKTEELVTELETIRKVGKIIILKFYQEVICHGSGSKLD